MILPSITCALPILLALTSSAAAGDASVSKRSDKQVQIALSGSDQCLALPEPEPYRLGLKACDKAPSWVVPSEGSGPIRKYNDEELVLDADSGDENDAAVMLFSYDSTSPGQKWQFDDDGRISIATSQSDKVDTTRYCLSKTDAKSNPIRITECAIGPDSADGEIKQVWEVKEHKPS